MLLIVAAAAAALLLSARDTKTPQEEYIARYSGIAVAEMYRSGVPASITLAQGLLESGAGRSALAKDANNHFGIKCHNNWKGRTVRADDDAKNECFRAYDDVEDSFRDHSDFLRYRDRYKFLFDLQTTDYKAWANGLKQAGYATDPSYAVKLIKYIEEYKLYEFDGMTVSEVYAEGGAAVLPLTDAEEYPSEIPESPLKIEEPRPFGGNEVAEAYSFSLSRRMYSRNGVPFVYAREGETYASIAKDNKLFLKELLRFNDLSSVEKLLPGEVVYLERKKKMAAPGLEKHIVENADETVRSIAQRYAIRTKNLLKLNGMNPESRIYEGDEILLRPAPPKKVQLRQK
jgi:uncharacterized FlgJ-related protein